MEFNKLEEDCNKANCIKYLNSEKKIIFAENNRKYIANNIYNKKIFGFWVDHKLIDDISIKKCDASIIVLKDICYLIELKGADIKTASKQLLSTIYYFEEKYMIKKFVCRIVTSKVNTLKLESINVRKLIKKLSKNNIQDSLKVKSKLLEEII